MSDQQEQIDPSIYQYDEVYESMKNPKIEAFKQGNKRNNEQRERSRQKQKTSGSKYIKKMKQIVSERQKAHEKALANKLERENQKLGITQQEVFVTESYLIKKRQQKQKEKKEKEQQKYDEQHSILNKKKNVHDFTRKLLEQTSRSRQNK